MRIFVAGHQGLVGAALVRALRARAGAHADDELILRTRAECDLLDQAAVRALFRAQPIDQVYVAAAKVGGIAANAAEQADFLWQNLTIATNLIKAAADHGVGKLLYLGSSCAYPRLAPQPIREEDLLTGPLEPTNEGYAVAKIAGLKLCEHFQRQHGKRFISAMPTNLYGPGERFHATGSHVVPGLLRRFHEAAQAGAPEVAVWGTGAARRELLHVDDLAEALLVIMDRWEQPTPINVGSGDELTIAELATRVATTVGYRGRIVFDPTKPDGTPRKALDSSRVRALGWTPRRELGAGLVETYRWAMGQGLLVPWLPR